MIRVVIVDDMLTIRKTIRYILETDLELKVVGEAGSGEDALKVCRQLKPDIVTMDINMPGMGGYEAIRQLMNETPCPIIVITGIESQHLVEVSFKALQMGALTVLPTPKGISTDHSDAEALIHQVKTMAAVKVVRRQLRLQPPVPTTPDKAKVRPSVSQIQKSAELVAIGVSTGGPPALQILLNGLPASFPLPIVIVQHISQGFVFGLASWLSKTTPFRCKVGEDHESIKPGMVYLAPDAMHLTVTGNGDLMLVSLDPMDGHRPSITVLFDSLAKNIGPKSIGILMTGMGQDGASGLKAMHQAGAYTIAQDEASSVIFSMPKSAIDLRAVVEVLDLNQIPLRLRSLTEKS